MYKRQLQDAEAEKESRINEAEGQVARFNSMYEEYVKYPSITRQRMFYEAMEDVPVSYTHLDVYKRQDGDCTGSCLAVYSYLQENFPEISVDVYLEAVNPNFLFLKGADQVKTSCAEDKKYDLFISLDASDKERLGAVSYTHLDVYKRQIV